MNSFKPLCVTRQGGVMTISVNDAPLNRMSFEYMDALEETLELTAADSSVRSLLFTAEGETNFSVGMDLKQMMREGPSRGGWDVILDQRLRVLSRIETLDKPSVATLFGFCLGGGLELPLACHFRFAADSGAQIGLPEMDLGTVPAWGGTARLTRCIGRNNALDMILRARKIDGAEALRIGLVQSIYPKTELKNEALKFAQELAEKPPIAMAGALQCLVGTLGKSIEEALRDERRAFHRCAVSKDQSEGLTAFLEKRKPIFKGH